MDSCSLHRRHGSPLRGGQQSPACSGDETPRNGARIHRHWQRFREVAPARGLRTPGFRGGDLRAAGGQSGHGRPAGCLGLLFPPHSVRPRGSRGIGGGAAGGPFGDGGGGVDRGGGGLRVWEDAAPHFEPAQKPGRLLFPARLAPGLETEGTRCSALGKLERVGREETGRADERCQRHGVLVQGAVADTGGVRGVPPGSRVRNRNNPGRGAGRLERAEHRSGLSGDWGLPVVAP
mmetsp:Transcript_16936/g.38851  ORF Transcript_16936/g.38851 Transcript_16936/m.38851 type:complete len:234 (+) Transcript_16936:2-703(+)